MTDEEMAEEYLQSIEGDDCVIITDREERKQAFLAGLKAKEKQTERVKYTLNKIIDTVCNDRINEYGARLVLINDFAYKCLQEIEK